MGVRAEERRPRDLGRRRDRPGDSAARRRGATNSPLRALEHALHPWVDLRDPAAVRLRQCRRAADRPVAGDLLAPLPLGIASGLFVGKQIGVFAATWLAVRFGFAKLPHGANWLQIYGVALLTGIGFTMSLFIGTLAFDTAAENTAVRIGVLTGSLLSAVAGYAVLHWAGRRRA